MGSDNTDNSYKHILKYTGVFASVQMLGILVGVIRNKFTAIFLGPSGMGLLSLFNSTATFVSSATNLGIPTSGVKVIADSKGRADASCTADTLRSADFKDDVTSSVSLVRSYTLLAASLGLIVCASLGPLLNLFTFSWGNHTLHYVFLAPTVFFTILAGGETAVLKALGQLKALATQASLLAIFSLVVSVPVYWLLGESGILAVLFLVAFCQWLLCLCFSRRIVRWHLEFSPRVLARGVPLLRLGISFVLSGMMNSGAEFFVRAFLNTHGGLEVVGLFNAGVTIVVLYAGMVFSVMESDFYPRLSSVMGGRKELEAVSLRNDMVNRQQEMNVLLIGPIISVMILFLPIIIPMLYSSEFGGMLYMAQLASMAMLFKAIYLPIEYLPLSRGESRVFFLQESFCVILLIVCEIIGYMLVSSHAFLSVVPSSWLSHDVAGLTGLASLTGLAGLGLGISLAYMIETLVVMLFSRVYYGYRMSRRAKGYVAFHFCVLFVLTLAAMIDGESWMYMVGAALLCVVSAGFSLRCVRKSLKADL